MFKNMATSLVEKGRVETTHSKAKELRSFAEHLITLGKQGDLHAKRQAFNFLRSRSAVLRLFADLSPRFKDRNGGYTRIFRLGYRHGDSAPMAMIEYLSEVFPAQTEKKDKKDKKDAKAAKKSKEGKETKKEAAGKKKKAA